MAELTNKGLVFGSGCISVRLDYAITESKTVTSGIGELSNQDFLELDIAAFLLGTPMSSKPMLADSSHAVFYNNHLSPCGSLKYSEVRIPASSGVAGTAKEKISANLETLPDSVSQIVFLAAIHNAHARQQSFSKFEGARVRIYDDDTNSEIMNLNLEEDMPTATGVEIARFCREENRWLFLPMGDGDAVGLEFYFCKYLDGLER